MTDTTSTPLFDIAVSVHVKATSAEVYALATDLTRMGEWSPENVGGEWIEGEPGAVGSRFRGDNQRGERTWSAECEIVTNDPNSRFTWAVGSPEEKTSSFWSFEFEADGAGTKLTQRLFVAEAAQRLLAARDQMPAEVQPTFLEARGEDLRAAMQQTVEKIKAAVEADRPIEN